MKRLALAALLLAAPACKPAAFLASPDDYAAYRRTRIGPTLEDRLKASKDYLDRYPEGAFQPDVKGYFDRAEPTFYDAKKNTIAGLEDYLRTLPRGPHGNEAEGRIGALRASKASQEGVAEELTQKIDQAGAERIRVREALSEWIDRFLDAGLWRAPLSQARASLIIPWSLKLPNPRCGPIAPGAELPGKVAPGAAVRRCAKLLALPYSVNVDGVAEAREATVEITVLQDPEGRPLLVSIGGPDLFLRLEETFTVRASAPGDGAHKVAAIARAVELVRGEFTELVSHDPSCKRQAQAPVFVELGCEGVRVVVRAAAAPGEDDVILFGPA